MKKKLICCLMVCTLSLGLLVACGGGDNSKNSDNQSQSDISTEQNNATKPEDPADFGEPDKDFIGDSYSDMGDGTFLLVNASGTTENGNTIVQYIDSDTILDKIGYEAWEFNGSALSYIYIDGMLVEQEQLGDTQSSLELTDELLSVGIHKVEVVQYEGDSVEGTVITYNSASYEIKEK